MENRIKELRVKYNMTQKELGLKIGVSRQTIISLENGKYNPSINLAFKVSKAFNLSIEDIFIYSDNEDN